MLERRSAIQLAAGAAGTFLAHRSASAAETIRLIVGFGPGSPMDYAARLIQEPFSKAMGRAATVDYVVGEGSKLAALEAIRSKPDSNTLLVAEVFLLVMHDARGANLLANLNPVAKLSRGVSYALVVRDDSALKDWAGLTTAAKDSRLKVATAGSLSATTVVVDMIEKRTALVFEQSATRSTQEALDLLLRQQTQLAAIDTRLALLHNGKAMDKVRILATFGARRSPELPLVPTFAEIIGDPKAAFTQSFAIFAAANADAAFVSRSASALAAISDDEAAHHKAQQVRFPLQIEGTEVLRQTIARDRRVIAETLR